MKPIQVILALALLTVGGLPSDVFSAEVTENSEQDKIAPERFEAKVLKVFAAKDGTAIFRAYVVSWKGQEVVVSDPLAKSDYKEGDTISVLAMNHPFPRGNAPHRLLAFTLVTPPPPR